MTFRGKSKKTKRNQLIRKRRRSAKARGLFEVILSYFQLVVKKGFGMHIQGFRRFVSKFSTRIAKTHPLVIVITVLVLGVGMIAWHSYVTLADAAVYTVNSEEEWQAGEYWAGQLDFTSTADALKIKDGGVGSWGLDTPSFPWDKRGWEVNSSVIYNTGYTGSNYWDGATYGADLTTDGTYIYMTIGGRQPDFFRYNPELGIWKQLADAPTGFNYGGAITYYDGSIYAINGQDGDDATDSKKDFFKYDIATDVWSRLADAPDTWGLGSDIVSGENGKIYAVQGRAFDKFWSYNTATGIWKDNENAIPSPYQVYSQNGHGLEFSSKSWTSGSTYCEEGCIYAFQGNNNTRFFRFDIKEGTWVQAANVDTDLGVSGRVNYGSSMAFDSVNENMFVLLGGSNDEFAQYDIDDDTWDALSATTPDANLTVNEGGSLVYLDGFVYALPGANRPELLKYDVLASTWDSITIAADAAGTYDGNLMVHVPTGADCEDPTGCLFVLRGDAAANFYRYDISTKTWTALTDLSTSPDYRPAIGSSMCYDSNNTLYYIRARNTTTFLQYDINVGGTPAWSTIAGMPLAAEEGAGITCLGDGDVYILQGNGTRNLYHYNGSWTTETIPDIPATNAAFYGGAITDNGDDVFVMPGYWRGNFYRYDPDTDAWLTTPSLADFPQASYYNTVLEFDGVDNIYAISSMFNKNFYRFDISENSWSKISDLPAEFIRSQGMAHDDANDIMYVRRGGDTFAVYAFSTETDEYIPSATWISDTIDLTYATAFNGLSANTTTPGSTSVDFYTRTSDDQVSWTAWDEVEQADWNIDSAVERYIQVKVVLNSDNTSTPTLTSFSINYEKDSFDPTNPTATAYSDQAKTSELTDTENYYYVNPYFEFSGASDSESGLAGYYVAWVKDADVAFDPSSSEDFFQTAETYVATVDKNGDPLASGVYHLRIATKDEAGNVSAAATVFTYEYDGISPATNTEWLDSSDFAAAGTSETNINTSANTGEEMALDSVANGVWTHEAPTPAQLSASTGNDGSSIAFNGTDTLFILQANNLQNLWAYSITNKTYDETHTAFGQAVTRGASMVYVPDNISAGCTDDSGCLFATAGNGTTFKKYRISAKIWDTMATVPQTVSYGGSLAYDGNDTIYATSGNSQYYTFKYTISAGTWSDVAIPDLDQTISYGHTLSFVPNGDYCTAAGGCLYATRGLNDNEFYKYEVGGAWTYANNVPFWVSYGATSYYLDGYVYLIRGHVSNDFIRYNIAQNTWETLEEVPTTKYLGGSNSMFYVENTDTLYVLRGEAEYSLLAYDVSENHWRTEAIPAGISRVGFYYGATAFEDDTDDTKDVMFIARGLNVPDFFAYYPESDTWERRADVPHHIRPGSDAEYVNHATDSKDGVYLIVGEEGLGDNIAYFYRYDPKTDLWTRLNHKIGAGTAITEPGYGADLMYDGDDTLYLITGNNTRYFYSYDITDDVWTQIGTSTNVPAAAYQGSCAVYATVGPDNYVYFIQSNNTRNIYRFNTDSGDNPGLTWETMAQADANLYYGDACVLDGQGNILVPRGNNTDEMYVYNLAGNSWTTRSVLQYYEYGSLVMTDNNIILGFRGESTSAMERYVVSTATTGFQANGSWTSQVIDFSAGVYGYGSLSIDAEDNDNTSLVMETRACDDDICTTPGDWAETTNPHTIAGKTYYSVASPVSRYAQVRVAFSSDQVYTSSVDSLAWTSYADTTAPNNPASVSGYTDSGMGTSILSDSWTADTTPYFSWSAADNAGGIGVDGFYVYFGTDETKDPVDDASDATNLAYKNGTNYYSSSNGTNGFWNAATQSAAALTSDTYYMVIRTKDRNNNTSAASATLFTYNLDIIAPQRPSSVSVNPASWTSTNNFDFTWPAATDTGGSGILEYCYTVNDVAIDCTSELFVNDLTAPQTRENAICVYATDNAGNESATCREKSFYYAGDPPSAPGTITADPETTALAPLEDVNQFSFTWDPPSTCLGSAPGDCDVADILRYCYTINELPSAETCGANLAGSATPSPDGGWTTVSQTSTRSLLSFSAAANQGENTIYIVAADIINNIDYDNYVSKNFYFSSNAPGVPTSAAATDTSDRATMKYSVVLTWDEPEDVGSGVEGYKVYRCEADCENPDAVDDPPANYSKIATVNTLGYLDTSLDNTITYSYFARAAGTGGTQSGNSAVLEIKPEGKFKFAPLMSGQPTVTPFIRSAEVSWLTLDDQDQYGNIVEHPASSYVEYGLTSGYGSEQAGLPDLVNEHEVTLTNLEPDTTYHYRTRWEDQDGNVGYSSDFTFETKGAPSAPINVQASPSSNTENSFAFSWDAPQDEGVTVEGYYYSINNLPNETNVTYTAETSLEAFDAATQQGSNTFYVLAVDDGGNLSYENYGAVTFEAYTTPPGAPQAVTIVDSSDRDAERYSITITWDPPEGYTTDDEIYYTILRSTDGVTYEEIATITSTGYLDTGLDNSQEYYYQIQAKDKAQALSDLTSAVSEVPEGRYTQPPSITEGPTAVADSFAGTITWRTERIASSFVDYGLKADDLSEEQGSGDQVESHEVKVVGLKSETTYYYRIKSIDVDENIAYSDVESFTTLEAPRVLDVSITDVKLYDALVSWTTNKETTAVIEYGLTTDYGLTYTDTSGSYATTHTVKLQSLSDSATYNLRLGGKDKAGNSIVSDNYVFKTLTFPEVSDVTYVNKAEGQTEVQWKTNVPTTSSVNYYAETISPKTQGNAALTLDHAVLLFGLADATRYTYVVGGADEFGYEAKSPELEFTTLEDTTPPEIFGVESESNTIGSGEASKIQIVVSWKSDEATTSQVQFGAGVGATDFTNETDENAELVQDHLVVISDLAAAKTYQFRVVSRDKAGNETKSSAYTVLTSRKRDSFLQLIIDNLEQTFSWLGNMGNVFGG